MDEYLKQIDAAIKSNLAIDKRTPWLETSLGHLRAAKEHFEAHLKASKKVSEATMPAAAAIK